MRTIYTTEIITQKGEHPVRFQQDLNRSIDSFQSQGLEVEVQFAPYRSHDYYDYNALVIARKPA